MKKLKIFTVCMLLAVMTAAFPAPGVSAENSPAPDNSASDTAPAGTDESPPNGTMPDDTLPSGVLTDPDIQAQSVLLTETETGKVLYEKDADKAIRPGGITTVMTLLCAVEAVEKGEHKLNEKVTVTDSALANVKSGDMTQNFQPGEETFYSDLLYCAYLGSASDACNIIAELVSGSAETFTSLMNETAKQLGCADTRYSDPAGTSETGQVTTARDQTLIFEEALRHPLFLSIAAEKTYKVAATNLSPERSLINANLMLQRGGRYYDARCFCGRTESSLDDGYSCVEAAKDNDMTLVSVVLGASADDDGQDNVQVRSYTETRRLYDWAFSSFAWRDVTHTDEVVINEPVEYGEGGAAVGLCPSETVRALLPVGLAPDNIKKDIVLYDRKENRSLTAPVKKGDILGGMTVTVDGTQYASVKLLAAEDVEMDRESFFKTEMMKALNNLWVEIAIGALALIMSIYLYVAVMYRKTQRENEERRAAAAQRLAEERQRRSSMDSDKK